MILMALAVMKKDHLQNAAIAAEGPEEDLAYFASALVDMSERYDQLGQLLYSAHLRVMAGMARHSASMREAARMAPPIDRGRKVSQSETPNPRIIRRALSVLGRLPHEALADLTERLVERLDAVEPDPDLEPETDACEAGECGGVALHTAATISCGDWNHTAHGNEFFISHTVTCSRLN